MMNPTKLLSLAALATMVAAAPAVADNAELRIATLAPSGSPWMQVLGKAQAEIKDKNVEAAGIAVNTPIIQRGMDEAVKIMGYAGFLAVVPWIQAFIWAFKPTDVVDIRRFPAEEAQATEEEIARLKGAADKKQKQAPAGEKPVPDNDTKV